MSDLVSLATLITDIESYITTNGTNDITGAILQQRLKNVSDTLDGLIVSYAAPVLHTHNVGNLTDATAFSKLFLQTTTSAAQGRVNLGLVTISQAEAEAGVATTERAWTAQRVAQAIAALAPGGGGGDAWGDAVDADIVPDADGTRDLGSSANRFAELHVDQIDLNGTTINSLEDGADVTDATNVAAAGALMTADAGALATLDTVDTAQIDTDAIQAAQIRNGAVEFAKIAPAAVVTEADTIAANDNDTTLPTSAAVKDYADKAVEAASGMVDQIDFESVEPGDDTITLRLYAHYAFTINELRIKTASGTCTVAVKIDGTDVTGISAVAVSSTEATGTATAANSVSVGQTVTLVISSSSSVANLAGSLKFTR